MNKQNVKLLSISDNGENLEIEVGPEVPANPLVYARALGFAAQKAFDCYVKHGSINQENREQMEAAFLEEFETVFIRDYSATQQKIEKI